VLAIHGTADEVVPVELGRDLRDLLGMHGLLVTYEEHTGDHSVSPDVVSTVHRWLAGLAPR
jgi:predicted esterase